MFCDKPGQVPISMILNQYSYLGFLGRTQGLIKLLIRSSYDWLDGFVGATQPASARQPQFHYGQEKYQQQENANGENSS
jgi:hypothetical protein